MAPLSLIPGAEPFFVPAGSTGCLLLHGFTATPNEVRELGEFLAGRGYTVLGPRLAHHGSEPGDMNRSRWHDWYLSALDGWHLLRGCCDDVAVVGVSMGGTTALLMAAREPVKAVVAIGAPMALPPDPRLPIARAINVVQPFLDKPHWDPSQAASRYDRTPVLAVPELYDYLEVVASALLAITTPVLLLHSRADETVPPGNAQRIFERLHTRQKKLEWFEDAGHVLTEDPVHKGTVFDRVAAFLDRWVGVSGLPEGSQPSGR